MGYHTSFDGSVSVTPPLNQHEISFLKDFNNTRRMHRTQGPLYVAPGNDYGQSVDASIVDSNSPHPDQPGLWCPIVPTENGTELEWDQSEKAYDFTQWLEYLVTNLLAPSARSYINQHLDEDPRLAFFTCDHTVDGDIYAAGEDPDDRWCAHVEDNTVTHQVAQWQYSEL